MIEYATAVGGPSASRGAGVSRAQKIDRLLGMLMNARAARSKERDPRVRAQLTRIEEQLQQQLERIRSER